MSKKSKVSRSTAAKRKLKGHLKTHLGKETSCYFTPTESVAWYWWRVINKAAFKNKLPYPKEIVIRKLRGAWGICDSKVRMDMCIITLSSDITNRKLFISTISHEMVHQWQFHYGAGNLHHGSNFRNWDTFFKNSFNISL